MRPYDYIWPYDLVFSPDIVPYDFVLPPDIYIYGLMTVFSSDMYGLMTLCPTPNPQYIYTAVAVGWALNINNSVIADY